MSVALKPGWNLVTVPKMVSIPILDMLVVHAADNPKTWNESVGVDVGTDYFQFVPGPNDAASGAPETGSFVAASDGMFHIGTAYYVRVLDPEGVTLNFEPSSSNTPNIAVPMVASGTIGWRMRCQIVAPTGKSMMSIIGESPTATDGFDNKFDSPLPPSMGALQISSLSTDRLYRDIRVQNLTFENYKMHVEGLIPGLQYTLRLTMLQGAVPYLYIDDPAIGYRRPAWAPATYTFVAKDTTRDITLEFPGGIK